jgi:hypothetical protein
MKFCMPLTYVVFPGYKFRSRCVRNDARKRKICCIYPHIVGKDFIHKFITKELLLKMHSNDDSNNNYGAVSWLRRLVAGFPHWRPGLDPRSDHVGFVVSYVVLGQVFAEYFGFPCQFSFRQLLHIHYSSYYRRYIVPTLTESVTNQTAWQWNKTFKFKVFHWI